jgi:ubiquinone/menaquinone biosynthesis C-methylase UbiE
MFDPKPIKTKGQVLDSLSPIGDAIQWLLTLGQIKCFYERLIDFTGVEEQDKVLDVGCGSGKLAVMLQAKVKNKGYVIGINPGPKALTKAQRRAEKESVYPDFRLGVIENLPFKGNYFDKVFATLMLHHLPRDLRKQGLKEVLRVLKVGGVLGIMDHGAPINLLAKFLSYPFWLMIN